VIDKSFRAHLRPFSTSDYKIIWNVSVKVLAGSWPANTDGEGNCKYTGGIFRFLS